MTDGPADDRLLFARGYDELRRFAIAVAARSDDPDEVLQEALYRILRRRQLSDISDFSAYARRTIVNVARGRYRKRSRERRAAARVPPADPAQDQYPSELAALLALPPALRAIVFLHAVEGYKHAEIGHLMGLREGAVRVRYHRAMTQLRTAAHADRSRKDA